MASVRSNLPEVQATITALTQLFRLDRPRRGKRLGDLAADIVAAGVQSRTLEMQKSPDGSSLPANRGRYGRKKRARGIRVGVGMYGEDVGGDMLEFEQVRGLVAIGPDDLSMTYGLDEENRQKAEWFSEGNAANNQPARKFYELDDQIEAELDELFDEAAEQGISDLGGV